MLFFFFFQAEDGIRDLTVTGVQTCALPIFVDDLQWLDPATLTLIEYLLLHSDTRHLLVIGAYRDNEVDSAHPLMPKLEDLRRAGARLDQIVLGPLTVEDINQLLCDTLRHAPDEMRPFAERVHRRR